METRPCQPFKPSRPNLRRLVDKGRAPNLKKAKAMAWILARLKELSAQIRHRPDGSHVLHEEVMVRTIEVATLLAKKGKDEAWLEGLGPFAVIWANIAARLYSLVDEQRGAPYIVAWLDAAVHLVAQCESQSRTSDRQAAKPQWEAFVDRAHENGAGLAHRWSKVPEVVPPTVRR